MGNIYMTWLLFIDLGLCRSSLCITYIFLKQQTKSSRFCAELFDTASVPAVLAIMHSFYLNSDVLSLSSYIIPLPLGKQLRLLC